MSKKISELLKVLNQISPFELQESWDNSGLIIGSKNDSFSNIYLSLEVDRYILESAMEDSVIITHHPLIFSPLKSIISESYPASLIRLAIQKNIKLISMHTNFDKTHFGKYIAHKILEKDSYTQNEFLVEFEWNSDFVSLCERIKSKLNIKTLKITKTINEKCLKVGLITGSGASFIKHLENIDCFITGDIKYHEAMEAIEKNINLIDCGHYELERYFGEIMAEILTNQGYKAIIMDSKNPFDFL